MAKKNTTSATKDDFEKVFSLTGIKEGFFVQPYDLSENNVVVRGRMPLLEVVLEKIVRSLNSKLMSFARTPLSILMLGSNHTKYGQSINTLAIPSMILSVKDGNLGHGFVIILSKELFDHLSSAALGGSLIPCEGTFEPGPVGIKIFEDLSALMIESLNEGFSSVFRENHVDFSKDLIEINPQMLGLCPPSDDVIVSDFEVQIKGKEYPFSFLITHESITNSSLSFSASYQRPQPKKNIGIELDKEAMEIEVVMNAELEDIAVRKLKMLKEGSILRFKQIIDQKTINTKLATQGDPDGHK